MQYAKKYDFVLVDDSHNEVLMFDMILMRSERKYTCAWISDSALVMQMVKNGNFPETKLLLLDIRMPIYDGLECLEAMKKCSVKSRIPIVMLSSSDHDKDITMAYAQHCNGYIVKSSSMLDFRKNILTTLEYWIEINTTN